MNLGARLMYTLDCLVLVYHPWVLASFSLQLHALHSSLLR